MGDVLGIAERATALAYAHRAIAACPPVHVLKQSGIEQLTFTEETPFWKSGGVGSLLVGRQQVRTLIVTLKDGVVLDYVLDQRWVNR